MYQPCFAVYITLNLLKPSRAEIVAALQSMTELELAETLHEALEAFHGDGERWCLAQVGFDSVEAVSSVELVAAPAAGFALPNVSGLFEQGCCEACGVSVISVSKRAVCPVCEGEVECT
jgi:hypothetical protein